MPACGQSGGAVEQPTGLFSVPRPSSPASKEKKRRLQRRFYGLSGGTCLPAGRAVARSNSTLGCSLCRALQVPPVKKKTTLAASFLWSEWRDLNPRPLPPQGSALPPEPHPDYPTANIIAFAWGFVKSFLKKNQFIFQGITFFGLFTIFYRPFSKNA